MEPPAYLKSVQFKPYTADEIRALSVQNISNPTAYSSLGNPLPKGLYDLALGPSPFERLVECQTCGLFSTDCPGHPGHIELVTPLFNPFYIGDIVSLLRAKCDICHRFTWLPQTGQSLTEKFKQLEQGNMFALQYDDDEIKFLGLSFSSEENAKLKSQLMKAKAAQKDDKCVTNSKTTLFVKLRTQLLKEFWSSFRQTCPTCHAPQSHIKKEGSSKIIREPLSEKKQKQLTSLGFKPLCSEPVILLPVNIRNELIQLWENEVDVLNLIYKDNQFYSMFLDVIPVQANRFRPENRIGEEVYLHSHTINLTRAIQLNKKLEEQILADNQQEALSTWRELQNSVNVYFDSSLKKAKGGEKDNSGIRQLLEKKTGLFRMKMMGKRVNYTARSVISPDPFINTNEIGIPVYFAKKLTFPVEVTSQNLELLQKLVSNGANEYPGANLIEKFNGDKILLENLSKNMREAKARLLGQEGNIVYRHVLNGDQMLVNRQPTLHKPSIMAHSVRVLPKQSTIRMHYANCSTYNADFDGDEINLHLPQTYMPVAEARGIMSTEFQYTVQTSGKPLRGLIQDMIVAAVLLTCKDTFVDRSMYMQLLIAAGLENVRTIKPCIIYPKELWSGKQVVTTLLHTLSGKRSGINLENTCKVQSKEWHQEENKFIVQSNYLCTGVLDKNQLGATEFSLAHAVHELYGEKSCSEFLTIIGRLQMAFLQFHGFTCGVEDLILHEQANLERSTEIENLYAKGISRLAHLTGIPPPSLARLETRRIVQPGGKLKIKNPFRKRGDKLLRKGVKEIIRSQQYSTKELDRQMISTLNKQSSKITNVCIPDGLARSFPYNFFGLMVLSGAKGSVVNHKQVSSCLGQQELEGSRVPITILGKSLPSFLPYDPHPRAGGFIADRFLTGLRPQEYYFHCMAGREGLVDTAVKTSKSGYLQRCLVKGLEGCSVQYDYSVRESDGSIIQFQYGEDAVDPGKVKYLDNFSFIKDNIKVYQKKLQYNQIRKMLDFSHFQRSLQSGMDQDTFNQENLSPGVTPGCMSDKYIQKLVKFIQENKHQKGKYWPSFPKLVALKYQRSLIQPGEMVGIIAAQSIGEPSTQLTLNTFHLAGHGGANVTLGIPRLREILLTLSNNISTPSMNLYFKGEGKDAIVFANRIKRLKLSELINKIKMKEKQIPERKVREYSVILKVENLSDIEKQLRLTWNRIEMIVKEEFTPLLISTAIKHLHSKKDRGIVKAERVSQIEDELQQGNEEVKQDKLEKQKESENQIKAFHSDKEKNKFNIVFELPQTQKNVLILGIIEQCLENTFARQIKGISTCHIMRESTETIIQTEGVNIQAMWHYNKYIDINRIKSNHIRAIIETYGIEAGVSTIISELGGIFSHYGIQVDKRHLSLIADHMTFNGDYRPFNRSSMSENYSPILRMSYERTANFIMSSALYSETDQGDTAASSIFLGKPIKTGTGCFDILESIK